MAIDYDSQLYFQLTDEELRSCTKIDNKTYVCSPLVIRNIDNNPNCIIDEIYERREQSTCPIRKNALNTTIWKQLDTPNHWMFIAPRPFKIAVICDGKREDVTLKETGIIGIEQTCIIKTKKTMLTSKQTNTVPVLAGFVRPVEVNMSTITTQSHSNIQEEPVIAASDELTGIQEQEESMQKTLQEKTWKVVKNYTMATSIGTSTAILTTIAAIIGIYKCAKLRHKKIQKTRREAEQREVIELQPLNIPL